MSVFGVYPFNVYVANIFEPGRNVRIKVTHYHHRGYYTGEEQNNMQFIIEPIQTEGGVHTIPGGYRLGFPMLMGDEYLEISLDLDTGNRPDHNYEITVGARARARVNRISTDEPILPRVGTCMELKKEYYSGGTWELNKDETDWKLTIRKYNPDPETDDVVIGPATPG